ANYSSGTSVKPKPSRPRDANSMRNAAISRHYEPRSICATAPRSTATTPGPRQSMPASSATTPGSPPWQPAAARNRPWRSATTADAAGDTSSRMRSGRSPGDEAAGPVGESSVRQHAGPPRGNHAGVDANPVEPAEQPAVFDLDATIHDRIEAGLARHRVGPDVVDTELLPQAAGADIDRLARDRLDVGGTPEHVDHVDRLRDVRQGRITGLAEDFRITGLDRDDPVAVFPHVLGGEVARPIPVGGQAHHGD